MREVTIPHFMLEALEFQLERLKDENLDLVTELASVKMKPINDQPRQGASFSPIEVNGDRISPENRPAVGTMMHRTNKTLDYLNQEKP